VVLVGGDYDVFLTHPGDVFEIHAPNVRFLLAGPAKRIIRLCDVFLVGIGELLRPLSEAEMIHTLWERLSTPMNVIKQTRIDLAAEIDDFPYCFG
jgi:hypothetical protein